MPRQAAGGPGLTLRSAGFRLGTHLRDLWATHPATEGRSVHWAWGGLTYSTRALAAPPNRHANGTAKSQSVVCARFAHEVGDPNAEILRFQGQLLRIDALLVDPGS